MDSTSGGRLVDGDVYRARVSRLTGLTRLTRLTRASGTVWVIRAAGLDLKVWFAGISRIVNRRTRTIPARVAKSAGVAVDSVGGGACGGRVRMNIIVD